MKRTVNALGKILVLPAMAAMTLPAQTFTTLFKFDDTNGLNPYAGLVQGTDGNFYGTTAYGGAAPPDQHFGTVFKITPGGTLTTLHVFCSPSGCTDGKYPEAVLVQGTDGDFYGTTAQGGVIGGGTVFKITPGGTLTTLYNFCSQSGCTDGDLVSAGVVQAANGDFYGTTANGGANLGGTVNGGGTVFKITPTGTLTTLYSFCSQSGCPDGTEPNGLVQAPNGDFYGTTGAGGANCAPYGCGTVFKITASGTLTTLYSFCTLTGCNDGSSPYAGLVESPSGEFYGTTFGGGANDYGTVFKITPSGILTTLYSFCPQGVAPYCSDGAEPQGPLIQGTDGNLYGTTPVGGVGLEGTAFRITPSGTLTTLHSFEGSDGIAPRARLVQATNGDFYGTAQGGGLEGCEYFAPGSFGCGTVFRISVGLDPFVKALPHAAKVGAAINILGTDLTGATSVSFNGTPAAFTVVPASEITASVPAGATTGKIQVATPGGTLSSGGPFLVLP